MKLVIYGSEMEKREQELLEHNGKYNNNKLEPQFDIHQDSVLEDEYDGLFCNKCLNNLNCETKQLREVYKENSLKINNN